MQLRIVRWAIAAVGILAGMASLGGVILSSSMGFAHGGFNAMSCLTVSVALTAYIAWKEFGGALATHSQRIMAISYAVSAGIALNVNLVWALWALKVPMDVHAVADGKMEQNYWLGPVALVYAVFCYAFLRWMQQSKD